MSDETTAREASWKERDDDFVELEPRRFDTGSKARAAITATTSLYGRRQTGVMTLSFMLDLLPDDIVDFLQGPRFALAYSVLNRALRLRACDDGRFEGHMAPRGRTFVLKFPLPERVRAGHRKVVLTHELITAPRRLILDLPAVLYMEPEATGREQIVSPTRVSRPPDVFTPTRSRPESRTTTGGRSVSVTAGLMGDPAPGRSALDARKGRGEG